MSSLSKVFFIKDLSSRLIWGNRSKVPNMSTDIKSPWIAGFLEVDFCRTSIISRLHKDNAHQLLEET